MASGTAIRELKLIVEVEGKNGQKILKEVGVSVDALGGAAARTGPKVASLTGSFVKAQAIWAGLSQTARLLWSSLAEGIKEMNFTESAFARAESAARRTGISFQEMRLAAEGLSTPLLESENALSQLAQLATKGFSLPQAKEIVKDLQDIAAATKPAGETVEGFSQKLIDGMTKGKFVSAELRQALPGLSEAMKKLGKDASEAEKNQTMLNFVLQAAGVNAGAAEKYLHSYAGQMEALRVTLSDTKEQFAAGFTPAISVAIQTITQAMGTTGDFKQQVFELGQMLGQVLVSAIKLAIGAGQGLVALFELLKGAYYGLKIAALDGAKAIVDSAKTALEAVRTMQSLNPLANKEALANLDTVIGRLGDYSGTLASMSEGAVKDFGDAATAAYTRATIATNNIGEALSGASFSMAAFRKETEGTGPAVEEQSEKAQKAAEKLKKELAAWGASITDVGGSIQDLNSNLELLSAAGTISASAMRDFESALGMVHTVDELTQHLDLLQASFDMTDYIENSFGKPMQDVEPVAKSLNKQLDLMVDLLGGGSLAQAMAKFIAMMKSGADSTQKFGAAMGMIGAGLREMAGEIEGTLGAILDVAGSFAESFAAAIEAGMSKAQAAMAGGAAALSTAVDHLAKSDEAKTGAAIGGTIGGIAGSFFGPLGTIVGSALGKAVGAFIGAMFAHDWAKDTKNVLDQFGVIGDISEGLMQKIEEDAKKYGDAGSAAVMNLKAMMDEIGVTEESFQGFVNTLMYGFDAVQKGFLTTEELAQSVAESFPALADAAIAFGGAYIEQLSLIIDKMKETGIGMDTLQAYFDQLQAKVDEIRGAAMTDLISQVKGLGDAFGSLMARLKAKGMAAGGGEKDWMTFLSAGDLTQAHNRFQSLERYFSETVANMRAQGYSMRDIFQQLGPLWEQLAQAAKTFGFETSKEFQELARSMELMKEFAAEFAKTDFIANIARDEARLGALTQKTFEDLEQSTFTLFKRMSDMTREQILDAAKNNKPLSDQAQDALQSTLPYLIQVIGMHNQMGLAISKNDQAMIKLAQDMGLLPDDLSAVGLDPQLATLNSMLEVLKLMAIALGVDASAFDNLGSTVVGWGNAGQAAWDWAKNITVGTDWFGGESATPGPPPPRSALLNTPEYITQPTLRLLDAGETVMPHRARDFSRQAASITYAPQFTIPVTDGDPRRIERVVQHALEQERINLRQLIERRA